MAGRVSHPVPHEDSTEAFEPLHAEIEANRSVLERRFEDRMRRTAVDAENATGREMALQNVSVKVTNMTIPQQYGVISYTFVWDGFAVTDDDRLRAERTRPSASAARTSSLPMK